MSTKTQALQPLAWSSKPWDHLQVDICGENSIFITMKCGGTDTPKEATPEIQKICDEIKPKAEEATGRKFDHFNAKAFTSQVVGGINYFIKVHVGGEEYVHLRVFKPLPHVNEPLSLHSHQVGMGHSDVIGYF